MTASAIGRTVLLAFMIFAGTMSLWKLFVVPDMSWFTVVGGSVAFAFYVAILKRRQHTQ